MLKLLTNIASSAEESNSWVSNFYQLLKFIINNVSTSYMVCGFIIVLCMFATTFKNLIYKVLNLAVLSVFVVALWAYLTDVTFIYVVYILTFVSAVVMLFLSVVLMLPSSAIAVSKRNFSVLLLVAGTTLEINSFTSSMVKLCLIVAVGYFMCRLPAMLNQNIHIKFAKVYRNLMLVYSIRNTDIGTWIIASRIMNFFEYVLRALNNAVTSYKVLLSPFKLHPAIVFKLSGGKHFNLPIIYLTAYYYCSIVNFIFTNIEAPKYCMTGSKCGFHFLTPYYDTTVPADNNNFPAVVYSVNPIGDNNKKIFIKNFFMFILVNGLFNLANTFLHLAVLVMTPANIELVAQVISVISIFFIALPLKSLGTSSVMYSYYLIDASTSQFAENLVAIQQGLYVYQPLLLLVSITGLLVALIGAPFFVSRSNK